MLTLAGVAAPGRVGRASEVELPLRRWVPRVLSTAREADLADHFNGSYAVPSAA